MATSEHEFQTEVLKQLGQIREESAAIKTQLAALVGADGAGGWRSKVDEQLKSLQASRNREEGRRQNRAAIMVGAGSLIGAFASALVNILFRHPAGH